MEIAFLRFWIASAFIGRDTPGPDLIEWRVCGPNVEVWCGWLYVIVSFEAARVRLMVTGLSFAVAGFWIEKLV